MDGSDVPRCRMTTKEGKPCAARPKPGTDLCPWHSPEHVANRKEYQRRGGYGKSNKARLAKLLPTAELSAAEILGLLAGCYLEIIAGERDPSQGAPLSSMARTMLEVRRVAELEEQLNEMFRRLGEFTAKVG